MMYEENLNPVSQSWKTMISWLHVQDTIAIGARTADTRGVHAARDKRKRDREKVGETHTHKPWGI
jgi:hypothetical protein